MVFIEEASLAREGTFQDGNRTLAYLDTGDEAGPLVLHNHGGPPAAWRRIFSMRLPEPMG